MDKDLCKLIGKLVGTVVVLFVLGLVGGAVAACIEVPSAKVVQAICALGAFIGASLGAVGASKPPKSEVRRESVLAERWRDRFSVVGWALVAVSAAGVAAYQLLV